MKTYTPEQLAEILGIKTHQVHYLHRRGLIPAPILPVPNARWNAEHVDYYLKHGMQKFQEVYCEVS